MCPAEVSPLSPAISPGSRCATSQPRAGAGRGRARLARAVPWSIRGRVGEAQYPAGGRDLRGKAFLYDCFGLRGHGLGRRQHERRIPCTSTGSGAREFLGGLLAGLFTNRKGGSKRGGGGGGWPGDRVSVVATELKRSPRLRWRRWRSRLGEIARPRPQGLTTKDVARGRGAAPASCRRRRLHHEANRARDRSAGPWKPTRSTRAQAVLDEGRLLHRRIPTRMTWPYWSTPKESISQFLYLSMANEHALHSNNAGCRWPPPAATDFFGISKGRLRPASKAKRRGKQAEG